MTEFVRQLDNTFLQKHDVKLYGSETDLYQIINDYLEDNQSEKAFYLIDLGEITKLYMNWVSMLPNVKPFYAVKCNPNPVLLEALAALGVNFDCASENEIKTIMEITQDSSRIIFANPCKMTSQIRYARANDVDLMTFDCEEELYKIKLYHPYANLILRLAVDDSNSVCKFNSKFGCQIYQVENLLVIAKTLKLNVIGFSFHVGSGCCSVDSYYEAISDCKKATQIASSLQIPIRLIDMGGGFPGVDKNIRFQDIAIRIKEAMSHFFGEEIENKSIQFIAEPGRYFAQKSHTLILNIIGKKVVYTNKKEKQKEKMKLKDQKEMETLEKETQEKETLEKETQEQDIQEKEKTKEDAQEKQIIYYLNDGIYGSFNCIYFDHYQPTYTPFNERDGRLHKSKLFGPTCDSIDLIAEEIMLPELAIGEWIYVENFGAYTIAASSAFNGFKTNVCKYIFRS